MRQAILPINPNRIWEEEVSGGKELRTGSKDQDSTVKAGSIKVNTILDNLGNAKATISGSQIKAALYQ